MLHLGLEPLILTATALMKLMLPVAILPIWNRFLTCTMLNLIRPWDWPKENSFCNSQQHACDFLSSVTTRCSAIAERQRLRVR